MKDNQLKQILNLIRRTGDRCVIADNESDEVFSVMRLSDYERLLNNEAGKDISQLSEEEMLNKINRDIAYWRSSQPEMEDEESPEVAESEQKQATVRLPQPAPINKKTAFGNAFSLGEVLKDKNYLSKNEEEAVESVGVREMPVSAGRPDPGRQAEKFDMEESLSDIPEDELEEEKFFLEPIE